MTNRSAGKHGGKRKGAGAPTKFSFELKIKVGQACEQMWRIAINDHLEAQKTILFEQDSDLRALWRNAENVPLNERPEWLKSEEFSDYEADFKVENKELAKLINKNSQELRKIDFRKKPPRGTRKKILNAVAKSHNLRESQVNNIWKYYRNFEKNLKSKNDKLDY
tara:strand:+ start:1313 stop:1807 length:495 start_codon:yes stop_codon:yes gene_type:complete